MSDIKISESIHRGFEIQDNDSDGNLSIGDEIRFNKHGANNNKRQLQFTVTSENKSLFEEIIFHSPDTRSTYDQYSEEMEISIPWPARRSGVRYSISNGNIHSVRFFGNAKKYLQPSRLSHPLPLDLNKTILWSSEQQLAEHFDGPYVSYFRRQSQEVAFVATQHTRDFESSTFQTIRATILDFEPDLIIVENRDSDAGISPVNYQRRIKKCSDSNSDQCPEPYYAAFLAHEAGIPTIHGEPSDAKILQEFINRGYTVQDLLGYYFLRGRIGSAVDSKIFDTDIQRYKSETEFNVDVEFTYSDFQSWFTEKTGAVLNPDLIESYFDTYPNSFIGILGREISRFRDQNILRLVSQHIDRHPKIMIVYGSGHLVSQRPVLEDYFGPSRDVKLF